jgi:hypothetical protein
VYKGVKLDCAYRLDLLVDGKVIVEIKSVDHLLPIHQAQLLSYLKLSGCKVGLLLNFNVPMLKDGIVRVVHGFPGSPRSSATKNALEADKLVNAPSDSPRTLRSRR